MKTHRLSLALALLGGALAGCTEDPAPSLDTPDLQLTCQPAQGTVRVGDSITITATFDVGAPGFFVDVPPLDWAEISEGGDVDLEPAPAAWTAGDGTRFERTVHATATRPGRVTIMTRWTEESTPPIFRQDRNTACTYDVVAVDPPPSGLTVGVKRAGSVTSTPAGVACTNPSFDTSTVECSAPLSGQVSLRATPAGDFGFSATRWTGCDIIEGNTCLLTVTAARRVDACFHDGSPAGLAACQ